MSNWNDWLDCNVVNGVRVLDQFNRPTPVMVVKVSPQTNELGLKNSQSLYCKQTVAPQVVQHLIDLRLKQLAELRLSTGALTLQESYEERGLLNYIFRNGKKVIRTGEMAMDVVKVGKV